MAQNPLVSVIVPAFNSEAFLAEAIKSVRAQTFEDWELLVIDDGSTDGTLSVAQRAAEGDPRIQAFSTGPSGGPARPRNLGIEKARGAYIAFLDADDLFLPEKLERQLDAMRSVEKPGLCYTYIEEFWSQREPPPREWLRQPPPSAHTDQYVYNLAVRQIPPVSTILMTREFLDEVGGFTPDEIMMPGEDWDFVNRCIWRRPLLCVPEVLGKIRIVPTSLSHKHRGNVAYRFAGLKKAEDRGELPGHVRKRAYSTAWLMKGEQALERGEEGWRRAFWRSLALNPGEIRRWPGAFAPFLPRRAMRGLYRVLKAIQRKKSTG